MLRADDSRQLADQLAGEHRDAALRVLRQGVGDAARAWLRATVIAADKGDHRAARDLLLATEVVAENRPANNGVVIMIGTPENPIRSLPPSTDEFGDR